MNEEDLKEAEKILSEYPALQPAPELLTDIKATIVQELLRENRKLSDRLPGKSRRLRQFSSAWSH